MPFLPTHRLFHIGRLHLTSGVSAEDLRFCSPESVAFILVSSERYSCAPPKRIQYQATGASIAVIQAVYKVTRRAKLIYPALEVLSWRRLRKNYGNLKHQPRRLGKDWYKINVEEN